MFGNLCNKFAIVTAFVALVGCLMLIGAVVSHPNQPKPAPKVAPKIAVVQPARKLTAAEDNFISFSGKWLTAYSDYSLDRFDKQARGAGVVWQGVISSLDHTGSQFYLIPAKGHSGEANMVGFEAIVILKEGAPYDARLRTPGTNVYVTGHVRNVSTSGAFVDPLTIEIK